MCVGGLRPGCRELHAGELHTRPQRAGQVEAEVFLATDQASDPRSGGGSGLPHYGRVAQHKPVELVRTRLVAALDARAYADGDSALADAGASRARPCATEGRAVRWSRCE